MKRFILIMLLIAPAFAQNAQTEKSFPTDEEITLVLDQTDRAVQQYKPILDQEDALMGKMTKETAEGMARARQGIAALETTIKAFRSNPQGFNGPFGFAFYQWLDDAARNALECSAGASNLTLSQVLEGNKDKA